MNKSELQSQGVELIEGFLSIVETGDTSQATQAISNAIEGSRGLQLAFIDAFGNFNQSRCLGVDEVVETRLATEFNTPESNPVIARMDQLPSNRFFDIRDFVDLATYLDSALYHELLRPREPCRVAMMSIPGEAGLLSLGLDQDPDASLQQAQVAAVFGVQIHRAIGLWFASNAPNQSAFLVDSARVALGLSAKKLDEVSLGTLTSSGPNRPVRTNDSALQSEFEAKLALAFSGFTSEVISPGDTGTCRIRLHCASSIGRDRTAWIEVASLRAPEWTPASLKAAYGLTNREVSVVLSLLAGQDTNEIAESLQLSVRSVRTYLSAIFEKTETSSQMQLLMELLGRG